MKPIFKTVFVLVALIFFVAGETVFGDDDPAKPSTDITWEKVGKTRGKGASLDQKPKEMIPVKMLKPRGNIVCDAEKTVVIGDGTKEGFLQLFRHMLPDLYNCYHSATQKDPIAKKQAVLRLVFSPRGQVERSELVSKDVTDAELTICIPKKAGIWRIPATSDGKPVTVEYSLVFE